MYPTRYIQPTAVGYLVAELVRCGKPNCRCQRGQRHGPYWYLVYRRLEDGRWRQRKRYVPKAEISKLHRQLAVAKARDRAVMGLLSQSRRLRSAVCRHQAGQISDNRLKEICDDIARETVDEGSI